MEKVLIAEDDIISRKILEILLLEWGFETLSADNGSDALKCLEADNDIKIALFDWKMPLLDGYVCRKI